MILEVVAEFEPSVRGGEPEYRTFRTRVEGVPTIAELLILARAYVAGLRAEYDRIIGLESFRLI